MNTWTRWGAIFIGDWFYVAAALVAQSQTAPKPGLPLPGVPVVGTIDGIGRVGD